MNPSEFFETVTKPNLQQAIEQDDDYRLTVNAILSVDALYGVLFEHLQDIQHSILPTLPLKRGRRTDADFKDHIALQSNEFRIVRDAAYATKHGRLNDVKNLPRLVLSAQDVGQERLRVGLFACGDSLGGAAVFIQTTDGEMHRSWYLLRRVEMFTERLLLELNA